jgi:hypothetical protein
MESNNHGNKREKWKIDYRNVTNDFLFQNVDIHQHYVLPVVRDAHMDLALYLRRLSASDDSMPVTIRNDTYRDMAKEIINKLDPYVFIRKGKWEKTQLQIKEDIEDLKIKCKLEEYLKSDKNFKDFFGL